MLPTITTEQLLELRASQPDLVVLDVRTPEEVADWSLDGVVNLPVEELAGRLDEVPRDRPLVVLCLRGRRSQQAGEILEAAGIEATLVEGGMSAWGRTLAVGALEVGDATVVQLRRVGKGCLGYLIGTGTSCVVIDPSGDFERLEREVDSRGWSVTAVIDTHLHADHISLAAELAARHGARLILADHGYEGSPSSASAPLGVGEHLALSPTVVLEPLATPGHTTGSMSYLLNGAVLFSGDTLFVDSVGRPDLADRSEEFAGHLFDTLHETLGVLPDEVLVLPSHTEANLEVPPGAMVGSTLGALRQGLTVLGLDREAFIAWAASQATNWPPNYRSIVAANRGLVVLEPAEASELELGPNRCAVATAPN